MDVAEEEASCNEIDVNNENYSKKAKIAKNKIVHEGNRRRPLKSNVNKNSQKKKKETLQLYMG
jgi:hypothetical protein